jgi:NADH dehydrogenase/NADH:ubiquinone oxidoreductase subunit G
MLMASRLNNNRSDLMGAKGDDIEIPTLCYHKDLSPTGNCRMCVVEVKGNRFLQAACVTQIANGMEIFTHSDKVIQSRKQSLEFMLANHPAFCSTCDVSGECEVQDLAYDYQVDPPVWGFKGTRYVADSDPNPFIRVDLNKCILCRRCVAPVRRSGARMGHQPAGLVKKFHAGLNYSKHTRSCSQCVATPDRCISIN